MYFHHVKRNPVRQFCWLFLSLLCISFTGQQVRRIQITGRAQGTTYSIIYYHTDSVVTKRSVDSLLSTLDASLSIYKPRSLINEFNASEKGVKPDSHLRHVISKALTVFSATDGAFDITIMPLTQAWGFGTANNNEPPTDEQIKTILPCIGTQHLTLTRDSLLKSKPCVAIDVNGIAQGYSVDVLAALLETYGITNYLVELGGEIKISGTKPGNQRMKIGIESPAPGELQSGILKKVLILDSGAITTSGNYRKFYESRGRIVSHLFDPKTGYSINNELISTTVYAPDAITADAYDNALMNMGLHKAMTFASQHPPLAAYFIYRDSTGIIRDTATANFYPLIDKQQ